MRAWAIVPAAVSERETAAALLEAGPVPRDLLADKGFNGRAFAAAQAARGTAVLVPPRREQRVGYLIDDSRPTAGHPSGSRTGGT